MAMQRIANPWISVRLRVPPPLHLRNVVSTRARVVKLVDTRDLKSLARKSVPVQVRPRAPLSFLKYWYFRAFSPIKKNSPFDIINRIIEFVILIV